MVIQQGIHVPIWGTSSGGIKITIEIAGQTVKCVTSPDGRWEAKLPVLKKGGPYVLVIKSTQVISFKNVMVGEVWLVSGQSNMEFVLAQTGSNSVTEIAAANYPKIREFKVAKNVSSVPLTGLSKGEWKTCTPENAANFSAVAYYFAKKLSVDQDVAVGIINSSFGGTKAEAWTSAETLINNPEFMERVKQIRLNPEPWEKLQQDQASPSKLFDTLTSHSASTAKTIPPEPKQFQNEPTALFNAMINPIIPYGIKGILWYQGESNSDKPQQYETLLSSLITDWRKKWKSKAMPFLYVQLPNFTKDSNWVKMREAQQKVLVLNKTGMAVSIDVGDDNDIHPINKKPVGERLYAAAKKIAYGSDKRFEGPHFHKYKVKGNTVMINIENSGLGLQTNDHKAAMGFELAGRDHVFYEADAKLNGKEILINSKKVSSPVAVRYAWKLSPSVNVYNSDNLPLAPFRTDNWK